MELVLIIVAGVEAVLVAMGANSSRGGSDDHTAGAS